MPVSLFSYLDLTLLSMTAMSRTDGLAQLSQNEYLVLAGTFHGVHAIASRISPIEKSSGVEVIEADSFKMTCFQTPTGQFIRWLLCLLLRIGIPLAGVKFVLITVPTYQTADSALRGVYEVYAEQLRDPFYAAEMPIRSETFDKKVSSVIRGWS